MEVIGQADLDINESDWAVLDTNVSDWASGSGFK